MLCRPLNKILHIQTLQLHHSKNRSFVSTKSKCQWRNSVFGAHKSDPMSSSRLRLILRDVTATRLWNACLRTQLVSSVVKRCRRERAPGVWTCFRLLLRPSRTLLLSATAYNRNDDDDDDGPMPCSQDISDEDLEALVHDFEGVDELSRTTLFCAGCQRRLVIDKQHPGVTYCTCSKTTPPGPSEDGWFPYMEADDVIIWRKEYKPGGLFAYKVYGRYKDLKAHDFAMIQVDGAYRRSWDDAVAALSIVEREANGVASQAVLHWEVLWPRLFANRDYVYLRRHKEFEVQSKCLAHKEAIFSGKELEPCVESAPPRVETPSVHTHAKLKAMELERKEESHRKSQKNKMEDKINKVFVIISRSCTHPSVPETRNAVRVQEYWSHMVVRTLDGAEAPGMEFVLTYYDEPSVGGLPSGVSAWATGRAAPSYLARMRTAAHHYAAWRQARQQTPDFEPFDVETGSPRRVDNRSPRRAPSLPQTVNELDMESSKSGPELDESYEPQDKSTQTDMQRRDVGVDPISKHNAKEIIVDNKVLDKINTSDTAKADDKVPEKVKVGDKVNVSEQVKTDDKVPEQVKVKVPEQVKVKLPEQVKVKVPEQVKVKVPEQVKADVKVIESEIAKADVKVKLSENVKVDDKVNVSEVKVDDKVRASNEVIVTEKVRASDKVIEGDEVSTTEQVKAEDIKDKVTSKELASKEPAEIDKEEGQSDDSEGDGTQTTSWWRYLHPYYYFV